jgi:hypothetical protein
VCSAGLPHQDCVGTSERHNRAPREFGHPQPKQWTCEGTSPALCSAWCRAEFPRLLSNQPIIRIGFCHPLTHFSNLADVSDNARSAPSSGRRRRETRTPYPAAVAGLRRVAPAGAGPDGTATSPARPCRPRHWSTRPTCAWWARRTFNWRGGSTLLCRRKGHARHPRGAGASQGRAEAWRCPAPGCSGRGGRPDEAAPGADPHAGMSAGREGYGTEEVRVRHRRTCLRGGDGRGDFRSSVLFTGG